MTTTAHSRYVLLYWGGFSNLYNPTVHQGFLVRSCCVLGSGSQHDWHDSQLSKEPATKVHLLLFLALQRLGSNSEDNQLCWGNLYNPTVHQGFLVRSCCVLGLGSQHDRNDHSSQLAKACALTVQRLD